MAPGIKYVLKEAMGWAVVAGVCVVALANYQALKQVTTSLLGHLPKEATQISAAGSSSSPLPQADEFHLGRVRLRRGRGGHYFAKARMNNHTIDVMVDTGATLISLTYEDAQRIGVYVQPSDFTQRSRTANGIARSAPINIRSVRIDDITVRNVRASVAEPGRMSITLLGMSFLGKLSRVEMHKGELILEK